MGDEDQEKRLSLRSKIARKLMGGLALAFGVVLFNLLFNKDFAVEKPIKDVAAACGMLLLGAFARWRELHRSETEQRQMELGPSLTGGLFGGLAGGAASGILAGVGYYALFHGHFFRIQRCDTGKFQIISPVTAGFASEVFLFCGFCGLVVGAIVQLGTLALYKSSPHPAIRGVNELGAVAGGVAGGALACSVGGLVFGSTPTPLPPFPLLAGATLIGAAAIVVGTLFYEYGGDYRRVLPALAIATFITLAAAGLYGAWYKFEPIIFTRAGTALDTCKPWAEHARGGAILGAMFGSVLGVQIGFTLLLSRVKQGTEVVTRNIEPPPAS